jgi:hypothetical protein
MRISLWCPWLRVPERKPWPSRVKGRRGISKRYTRHTMFPKGRGAFGGRVVNAMAKAHRAAKGKP